jgi:AcrR family transcriptional regulator
VNPSRAPPVAEPVPRALPGYARRMPRPREPLLSKQRIVDAATAIVDAEGMDALSTRRLARELEVRAPSLYNHFATKDEILDAIGDAIIARVDIAMLDGAYPWDVALELWARAYRAAFAAHPNLVPFLVRGPARRPAALRMADAVYGALVEAGWPRGHATRIAASVRYFVAGSTLGSFALGFPDDPALYAHAEYPHLGEAHRLREHRHRVDEGAFELGLTTLVNGYRALYAELVGGRGTSTPPDRQRQALGPPAT